MKFLRNFSRILIGIVFIFSGFVKVVDPMGYAYKFVEYFDAMHITFMNDASLVFAMLMAAAELLLGIALLFNLVPKFSAWILLAFMVMFTPLTLWLAIANPVSDCGCFGDALVISNWQTFFKNVIIDVFVVIIFISRNKYKPAYHAFFQWCLAVIFIVTVFGLEFYCLKNIPILDFRPYHIGANIKEGMVVPESEKDNLPIYENVYVYEKDNVKKEFVLNGNTIVDFNDKTEYNFADFSKEWKFIDRKDKLVKAGYVPPIHDFTIEPVYIQGYSIEPEDDIFVDLKQYEFMFSDNKGGLQIFRINNLPDKSWSFIATLKDDKIDNLDVSKIILNYIAPDSTVQQFGFNSRPPAGYIFKNANEYIIHDDLPILQYGEDIANYVLNNKNYSFLAISLKLEDANEDYVAKLNTVSDFCYDNGYDFYCLTGSTEDGIRDFIAKHNPNYGFFNTDQTTLKTIIRSNPGLLLIKDGVVLKKWAARNIPDTFDGEKDLQAQFVTSLWNTKDWMMIVVFILGLFLFMGIFHIGYSWLQKEKIL